MCNIQVRGQELNCDEKKAFIIKHFFPVFLYYATLVSAFNFAPAFLYVNS